MKYTEPVTLSDLEATAKDDKYKTTLYRYLQVYSDDTGNFTYTYKAQPINKTIAEEYLKSLERKK